MGLGALFGAILGGGKGAAVGAGAGAAGGLITQIFTRGKEIKIPVESVMTFRLDRNLVYGPTNRLEEIQLENARGRMLRMKQRESEISKVAVRVLLGVLLAFWGCVPQQGAGGTTACTCAGGACSCTGTTTGQT